MQIRTNGSWASCNYSIMGQNTATVENSKTIPIYSNSHNLFDESQIVNDTPGNSFQTFRIQLTPNTSYTMSSNVPLYNQGALIVFAPDGTSSIKTGTHGVWEGQSRTFTSPESGKMIVGYRGNSSGYDLTSYWYMINEGSTALPYEPYHKPLVSYSFEGQCNQASTPTPTVPVEVGEFGDKTVNLYNDSTTTDGYRIYWNNGNPYPAANAATSDYIPVTPGTTYSLSAAIYIAGYDSNKTFLGTWSSSSSSWSKTGGNLNSSITPTNDCYYLKLIAYNKATLHNNFMLNEGSTVLSYEPYGKYKIPVTSAEQTQNIILSEPLRKIGDYADTIDSEGVVTRKIGKYEFTGDENFTKESLGDTSNRYHGVNILNNCGNNMLGICTHYKYEVANTYGNLFISSNKTDIFILDSSITSATDLKTFLAQQYANSTPVTVYYVLATAVAESTTVPTIPTSSGYSNIEIGTSLAPSKFTYDLGKMFMPQEEKVRVNGEWV